MVQERIDGINAGAMGKVPGPCGRPTGTIRIERVRLWPTILWRPIREDGSGWTLEETPDLDGLMVPRGGHRDIETMWSSFQVFPDNPAIVSVYPTARSRGLFGPRRTGTAIRVFGKSSAQPTYLRAVSARGVERSRLVIRVKEKRSYKLKLWFLADGKGQISKRTAREALGALARATQIFGVQSNVSFENLNNGVPLLTGPDLQKTPVGLAFNWRTRSRDVHQALHVTDKNLSAPILAHVIWINRMDGIDGAHEGGVTYTNNVPIFIFVTDQAPPEIKGEVLAHELGHALLDSHSAALGYDGGHSTDQQDLMFPTAERHGRIRLRLDEVRFINP